MHSNTYKNYLGYSNYILKEFTDYGSESIIYHYTSEMGFKAIIENKKLRFTDSFFLNDRSEGTYVFDLMIENLESIFNDTFLENEKETFTTKIKEFKELYYDNNFRVYQFSCSLNPDSLCMWNYYTKGDDIRGFALGFSSKDLCDSINLNLNVPNEYKDKLIVRCGKVIYDKEEQLELLKKCIGGFCDAILKDANNNIEKAKRIFLNRDNMILERIAYLGTFFKSFYFMQEEEYRVAITLFTEDNVFNILYESADSQTPAKPQYTYNHKMFIPYTDLQFSENALRQITCSPTMDFEFTRKNIKQFINGRGYRDIEIIESDIPVRF